MRRFRIVAGRKRRPRPQPDPMAVLVAHPEFPVEHRALAAQQFLDHEFDVGVFRMQPFRHFAETQKLALGRQPEDFIHGLGPKDRALGQVPVPHAAVAAVQRLVQPLGGDGERGVGFRGFRRLPVKGSGQHGENQDGGNKKNGKPGDPVAPRPQQVRALLEHHKASRKSAELARRHVSSFAVCQHEGTHGLGVEIRIGDELRPEHVGDLPAGKFCRGGRAGNDLAEIVNQREHPVLGHRTCRQRLHQKVGRQGAHRLSVRHIRCKCRDDPLRREFRMQNG